MVGGLKPGRDLRVSYADSDRMTVDEPEEVQATDINTLHGSEAELSSLELIKQMGPVQQQFLLQVLREMLERDEEGFRRFLDTQALELVEQLLHNCKMN